jgi:tetratricopeptide (TPR) repeat protein
MNELPVRGVGRCQEAASHMRAGFVADAASRFAVCALATCLVVTPPSFAIEQPSAEAQATLRRGFKASSEGSAALADTLLTQSIVEWKATKQAPDEIAAIYKQRGTVRQQQNRLAEAAADLTEALKLDEAPAATPDPAEVQRTYVLRARVNAALKLWAAAEADLTAAIDRLDSLDAIESTNPYLFSERGSARSRLGDYEGAADDALRAEADFKAIGDKVHRLLSSADSALALYGAGDVKGGVEAMRYVFKNKGMPASNNPDDIGLLQELSRKDAELHLAYASHLYGVEGRKADAMTQWESGCIRIEAYVADGTQRVREEDALREKVIRGGWWWLVVVDGGWWWLVVVGGEWW